VSHSSRLKTEELLSGSEEVALIIDASDKAAVRVLVARRKVAAGAAVVFTRRTLQGENVSAPVLCFRDVREIPLSVFSTK
jgi:hypothetical protein